MKKVLFLMIVSFFVFNIVEISARVLTTRQLLLLQIPSKFVYEVDGISWSVVHAPIGPIEEVAITLDEGKLSIYTIGENVKEVAIFKPLPEGGDYETVFKAKIVDGKLTLLDEKSKKKFSKERLEKLVDDLKEIVDKVLTSFDIKSDTNLEVVVEYLTILGISKKTAL